jgi:hypothetical protein
MRKFLAGGSRKGEPRKPDLKDDDAKGEDGASPTTFEAKDVGYRPMAPWITSRSRNELRTPMTGSSSMLATSDSYVASTLSFS